MQLQTLPFKVHYNEDNQFICTEIKTVVLCKTYFKSTLLELLFRNIKVFCKFDFSVSYVHSNVHKKVAFEERKVLSHDYI